MEREDVLLTSTFALKPRDVVLEKFADETVAVHLGTGRYFSIDLAGTEVVELVGTGNDLGAIVAHLAPRYKSDPAVIERAVTAFVGRLLDEGLILHAPDGGLVTALPDAEPATQVFPVPTLVVYSDMEDLLLLDPIHDVDETGWPVRAEAVDTDPAAPRDTE